MPKLKHFHAYEHVMPNETGLQTATKDFMMGDGAGTEWIDVPERAILVHVRRDRLPDIIFTAVGYGIAVGDGTVPGGRSGNPVEDRKGKR